MRSLLLILSLVSVLMSHAQTKIYLTVGNDTRTATLADNDASAALLAMLADGPLTISMSDYGGFEKVGDLPQSLPASDTRITAQPCDIMLYLGRSMVIFYGSNTWSYTRLGRMDGMSASALREFLGSGNINLTLSLTDLSGITEITAVPESGETVFNLKGNIVAERPLAPGIYIINGKKTIIR